MSRRSAVASATCDMVFEGVRVCHWLSFFSKSQPPECPSGGQSRTYKGPRCGKPAACQHGAVHLLDGKHLTSSKGKNSLAFPSESCLGEREH